MVTGRTRLGALLGMLLLAASGVLLAGQRDTIHADAGSVQPLLPGMEAPAFDVVAVDGTKVSFDPAALQRPVVMTFYRGGWCPYCNLHLAELRHAEAELKALGFAVWFLSMDRPEVLADSESDEPLGYTLLSDAGLEASRGFGIAFRLDDEIVERFRNAGLDLEAESGQTHHVLPAPSTFIVGEDGIVRFQYTNPNYKVRLHPDVLLAAARAISEDQRLVKQRAAMRAASD